MVTKINTISANKYVCDICDITCCKKNDWSRHILTKKHLSNKNGNIFSAKVTSFECKNCSKIYKSRKGLWGHNKTCNAECGKIEDTHNENVILLSDDTDNKDKDKDKDKHKDKDIIELLIKENTDIKNIMLEVVRSNADLQKQLLDVCKNVNSHNTINSHNKTFNLQLFLNEQCKDAMNISDFVNSFDLQLTDLESVGDLGYVEGMAKIFLDKLSSTDIYKRPMHCSDAKRETIYIKDEDKWEKEHRTNPKLRHAIKTLSFKNMKLANLWSDTYPDSKSSESHLNDVYMKLVIQSTGGSGEIGVSEDKIIKRIAKEIVIDKPNF